MVQFGGALGGAAGPIRAVSSRTCDMLPIVTRVAELLHPGLDLAERQRRLLARLELGVPASIADVAGYVGSRLTRSDYLRLVQAGLTAFDTIAAADDPALLACVDGDNVKLAVLRNAVQRHGAETSERGPVAPILPPPEA